MTRQPTVIFSGNKLKCIKPQKTEKGEHPKSEMGKTKRRARGRGSINAAET